jgi:mono/diheme cytochrome c family protein
MYDQPRYKPLAASDIFRDGSSARPLEPGTIARGQFHEDELLATGKINGQLADQFPFPIDRAALERGRERFLIYCSPCHGATGDGRGMIVQRGFPPPPPFYGKVASSPTGSEPTYADLREAPAGHFFDVITNGHGTMYSYASRVGVEDRWKIAAYIRALQLSQYATVDQLRELPEPTDEERRLVAEAPQ